MRNTRKSVEKHYCYVFFLLGRLGNQSESSIEIKYFGNTFYENSCENGQTQETPSSETLQLFFPFRDLGTKRKAVPRSNILVAAHSMKSKICSGWKWGPTTRRKFVFNNLMIIRK